MLQTYGVQTVKTLFEYAYNPYKMYYLKFPIIDLDTVEEPRADMYGLLDRLRNREITGKFARTMVENYAEEHGDLIKMVCNKDLQCGVDVKTLNEVWGKGFVPQFELQLADKMPLSKINFPCLGQIKYDGVRVVAFIRKDRVEFRTRNGQIFMFPALAEALMKTVAKDFSAEWILDGELASVSGKQEGRTSVSGLVNSAIKGTPITSQDIVFHAFDLMSIKEFEAQDCDVYYRQRRSWLELILSDAPPIIRLAKTYEIADLTELDLIYKDLLKDGYEGMILKHDNGLYKFKRTRDWVKIKAEDPTTLTCTAIEDGTKKYTGMIGALVCEGVVKGKQIKVSVGTGLTDEDRAKDHSEYIGQKIDINYNAVTQDKKTGKYSLFLPVFKVVRGDL